jgi:hypothetical protein
MALNGDMNAMGFRKRFMSLSAFLLTHLLNHIAILADNEVAI